MHEPQIITIIEALRARMEERFDLIDTKFDKFNERVGEAEDDLTRIKTAGVGVAGVLTFLGWDHIKPWILLLTKT